MLSNIDDGFRGARKSTNHEPLPTMKIAFIIAAWASLLAIAIVTIGPISVRPATSFSPDLERVAAWACVAVLFGIAYPTRSILMLLCLVGAAAVLELSQLHALGRHGEVSDFLFKTCGVLLGIGALSGMRALRS